MTDQSFNLVYDPWIKVLSNEGSSKTLSLIDLFKNSADYQRLAGEMVAQDLAILRLLESILTTVYCRVDSDNEPYEGLELDEKYKVIDHDEDDDEEIVDSYLDTWEKLFKSSHFSDAVIDYLEKNSDRFNFFGQNPFYQVNKDIYNGQVPANKKIDVEKPKGTISVKQINRTISESNNSPAIFSPKSANDKNKVSLDELIRWIIAYQNFTGVTDKTKVQAKDKFSVSAGWLYGLGTVYAQGNNLFETLMLNLVFPDEYKEQKPVWEFDSPNEYIDFLKTTPQASGLSISTIYTLWSRMLHIEWKDKEPIIFSAGLPKLDTTMAFSEPMTTWRKNKDGQYYPAMKHQNDLNRAMWRNFGQYVATSKAPDNNFHEPGITSWLKKVESKLPDDYAVTLKTTNFISDGNATSQSPIAEDNDSFNIRSNVLLDPDVASKDFWPVHIENMIETTQVIGQDFWRFSSNVVSKLRNLDNSDLANEMTQHFYESLNRPFLDWLASLRSDQERTQKIQEWTKTLKDIAFSEADNVVANATPRDIIGKSDGSGNLENIFTYYNWYKLNVMRHLKI